MYEAPTNAEAAAEQASTSRARLSRLGREFEGRRASAPGAVAVLVAAAAIVDAMRELTYALRAVGGGSNGG